jgi:hypothetical protein
MSIVTKVGNDRFKGCRHKQIFEDVQKAFQVGPITRVKAEVVREMQIRRTPDWQYLNKKLSDHLAPRTPN